jgi:class 3 adenylate cyclase
MSTLYGEPVDAFSNTAAGISTRRQEARRHAPASFPRRTPDPVGSHRRDVAIMFVDITGFTRLTERVDPAVVYRRVSPLLDDLVLHVHEHGGQVQQVLGDGFMAAFGLHSTHGDEAERAVRAGHAMLACGGTKPAPLDVHVGIERGEVLVTRPRYPASFGVWGHAVNVARRLCDTAAPAQLVVGSAAYTRCGRKAGSSAPVLLQLHSMADPIVAYRIAPG